MLRTQQGTDLNRMAIPTPNPSNAEKWLRLGAIVPRGNSQLYPNNFIKNLGTFRLNFFDTKNQYLRYCSLRIIYLRETGNLYTRYYRIYASKQPLLFYPKLDINFNLIPKTIEISDKLINSNRKVYRSNSGLRLIEPITWSLTIDVLV